MQKTKTAPTSSLCRFNESSIFIRDRDLCEELIGKVNFTQMIFFDILGRMPSRTEEAVINAMMVTLMEHGLAPSAIATRLVYSSAPEALQGAVAAGLLGAGSVMLGTLEQAAELLEKIVQDPEGIQSAAEKQARWYRENRLPLPGFGHPDHKPDDPRTTRLFALAEELDISGRYVQSCKSLSVAVDEVYGKHITVNASASMAALLCEIGIPKELMRGFAVICRSAGLVAHVCEEMNNPLAWTISQAAEDAVSYRPNEPA